MLMVKSSPSAPSTLTAARFAPWSSAGRPAAPWSSAGSTVESGSADADLCLFFAASLSACHCLLISWYLALTAWSSFSSACRVLWEVALALARSMPLRLASSWTVATLCWASKAAVSLATPAARAAASASAAALAALSAAS